MRRFSRIHRLHNIFYKIYQCFKLRRKWVIDIINTWLDTKHQKFLEQRLMPIFELFVINGQLMNKALKNSFCKINIYLSLETRNAYSTWRPQQWCKPCLPMLKISHFTLFPISDKTPICWESKVFTVKKNMQVVQCDTEEFLKVQGQVAGLLSNWGQKAYWSFLLNCSLQRKQKSKLSYYSLTLLNWCIQAPVCNSV